MDWILIGRDWLDCEVGSWTCSAARPGDEMRGAESVAVELFRCRVDPVACIYGVPVQQFGLRSGGFLGMENARGLTRFMVLLFLDFYWAFLYSCWISELYYSGLVV